ncbi:hypothetical protein EMCG_06969 [[Emmonsia] crescens]|uniref:Uncharacterized protein n=1 Tax=[Emmonsia] crescens TaxID=73230 RepID=A0A0G2J662_9EURO|nr:hypothetical protein EMCG_06969 [Emmonsia crescens UAMH 3008]
MYYEDKCAFGTQQRVSLIPSRVEFSPDIGLFYNRDEYDDVVKRTYALLGQSFTIHPEALAYLFSISNGHPAAVSGLLKHISK